MPARNRPRTGQSRPAATQIEVVFLPGLDDFVHQELHAALPPGTAVSAVPGREDAVQFAYRGEWGALLDLRTVVAAFAVLTFPVPRPRSLSSGEYFPQIVAAVASVRRLNEQGGRPAAYSFRFEAAGSDSVVFQKLAAQLTEATGLVYDPHEGDVVLRVRRTPATPVNRARRPPDEGRSAEAGPGGWDVLVRLSTRPLSDRAWRQANYPGAVNATIAAAIALATAPRPGDRVVNLMCGSGTLLIERLTLGPARSAVAVDSAPEAIRACAANLAAAGLPDVTVVTEDVAGAGWAQHGPFDVLLADPPWGHLVGDRRDSESTHRLLLERAAAVAAPRARLVVLTHEIKIMERCLDQARHLWRCDSETRVFQKGHHPRIYVLRQVPDPLKP